MREFIALARNLNFTNTSDELFITQSSLTRHITKMESELGVPLLLRSTHRVDRTECGEIALAGFVDIITTFDRMQSDLKAISSDDDDILRLGMLYYALDDYYYPIFNHYRKKHPRIKLELLSCQPPFVIKGLLRKKIDVGLLLGDDYPDCEHVCFHPIGREKPILMYSGSNSRLKGRSDVSLRELQNERLVFVEADSWLNQQVQAHLNLRGLHFSNTMTVKQIDLLPLTIAATNSVSIVANHLRNSIVRKGICYADIEDLDLYIDVCLVTLKNETNQNILDLIAYAKRRSAWQARSFCEARP